MAFKKNTPGCNASSGCGCGVCRVAADSFTRADNVDITVGAPTTWSPTDTSYTNIDSNNLIMIDWMTICQTAHPAGDASCVVSVDLQSAAGGTPRVIVGYTDANNYYYAQVMIGAGGCLLLGKVSGGTDTQLYAKAIDTDADTWYNLKVWFDGSHSGVFAAHLLWVSHVDIQLDMTVSGGGSKCGLSADSANVSRFKNWTFDKYFNASGAASCEDYTPIPDVCLLGSDSFSGSSLSCVWQVLSGSPTISGGKLTYSGANVSCKYLNTNRSDTTMYAKATVSGPSGAEIKIIVGDDGAGKYYYVKLTIGSLGTIKVYSSSGGSDTQLATQNFSSTAGNPYYLSACLSAGKITGWVGYPGSGAQVTVANRTITPSYPIASRLACGTNSGSVTFDDFQVYRPLDSLSGCPDCEQTGCSTYIISAEPTYWEVDFGAGGWTPGALGCSDGGCDYTGLCIFDRHIPTGPFDGDICTAIFSPGQCANSCNPGTFNYGGRAVLRIGGDLGGGVFGITVEIIVHSGGCTAGEPACACEVSRAKYGLAISMPFDPSVLYTLNRLSQSHTSLGGYCCQGSLPTTITVQGFY